VLSSDDDPHLGQVAPHLIILPAPALQFQTFGRGRGALSTTTPKSVFGELLRRLGAMIRSLRRPPRCPLNRRMKQVLLRYLRKIYESGFRHRCLPNLSNELVCIASLTRIATTNSWGRCGLRLWSGPSKWMGPSLAIVGGNGNYLLRRIPFPLSGHRLANPSWRESEHQPESSSPRQ